jgi:hypothetical protein
VRRVLLAAGVTALAAGCASGQHAKVAPQRGPTAVPRGFHPETAAAVGTRDYWLLGDYRCGSSFCIALIRSTDAGKHFMRVGAPRLSAQGTAPIVVFATARDGYAYAPGGPGPLYESHDRGRTWRAQAGGSVDTVAASGGNVYKIARGGGIEWSPAALGRSWNGLGPIPNVPVGRRPFSLAVRGSRIWLLGPPRHHHADDSDVLARLNNPHGFRWRTMPGPCLAELGGSLAPAGHGVVWAVCTTGMMAGLWVSTNDGRSFAIRSMHDPGGARQPALTNGAEIFPLSRNTAILNRGVGGPLLETMDQGRHWSAMKLPFRIAQLEWLGFTTRRFGLALVQTHAATGSVELWRTKDGGTTWKDVPIRR